MEHLETVLVSPPSTFHLSVPIMVPFYFIPQDGLNGFLPHPSGIQHQRELSSLLSLPFTGVPWDRLSGTYLARASDADQNRQSCSNAERQLQPHPQENRNPATAQIFYLFGADLKDEWLTVASCCQG